MEETSARDVVETKDYYEQLYAKHGFSPQSLGWQKGRQFLRFDILLSEFLDLESPRVLDIGCGFGDLNLALRQRFSTYSYVGVEVTEVLLDEARRRYKNEENISFVLGDFLEKDFQSTFDIAIACGTFNKKFTSSNNWRFVERAFSKAFSLCNEGVAFDFLSDKVDYEYDHTYHASPEQILSLAYKSSRNIVLKNNYMPFEFCIVAFKDDSFTQSETVFSRVKQPEGPEQGHV